MNAIQSASTAGAEPVAIFEYSGRLSESVVVTTSQSLRARLSSAGICANRARKVFSSYVELAYNILNYAQDGAGVAGGNWGMLVVTSNGQEFTISSGNRISKAQAELLTFRLAQLRSMSTEEIRFEYRLRLTNLQFQAADQSSKGASLGLLTVARNSVRPLEYSVHWDDAECEECFISIRTSI